MVQYLKIASHSVTNEVDMFTLGVSTARGDETKIGKFGSGSLMSTLLWLRLHGVSPVYMLNGVRVEFIVRQEKTATGTTFDRVYQVVDGVESPLTVCLAHGEQEWAATHMALREWVCNAIDQGETIHNVAKIVDTIDANELDTVAVYVPCNAEVRKYFKTIGDYFLHVTYRQDMVCIQKNEPSPCKLYRKGVYVRTLESVNSLFDYNLADLDINECRTGGSDSMTSKIRDVLDGSTTCEQTYFAVIFRAVLDGCDCWEVNNAPSYVYSGWCTFLATVSPGIKIIRKNTHLDGTGYRIDSTWFESFTYQRPALSGYADLFAAEMSVVVSSETPEEVQALANDCWAWLSSQDSKLEDKTMPTVCTFTQVGESAPRYPVKYDSKSRRVFIWKERGTDKALMLSAMIEASGLGTYSADKIEFLLRVCANLY